MIYLLLVLLGLCFGSFVNALVWRLRQQSELELAAKKKRSKQSQHSKELSIVSGRSMCSHCRHELAVRDLVPVLSWLSTRGKCRYCGKPIEDSPLVELVTAGIFVLSYLWWPFDFTIGGSLLFGLWLAAVILLVALVVYDLKWMQLPNRLTYPLIGLAALFVLINALFVSQTALTIADAALGLAGAGGLFYVLFQVSGGKWIGGGDVKLGFGLGLLLGSLTHSLLMVFVASSLGSLFNVPLLLAGKRQTGQHIPFGPFLIVASMIVFFFGSTMMDWYRSRLLGL